MKKRFFMHGLRLVIAGMLLSFGAAHAVVVWNGAATDATNEDVDIDGDSSVGSDVLVRAQNTNVNVNVNVDVKLFAAAGAGLCFLAETGRTITVKVNNDLLFTGDDNTPLVVTIAGAGKVIFILEDNKKVEFTSEMASNKGTKLFLIMDGFDKPTLEFIRKNAASANRVDIVVGAKSVMSYLAPTVLSGSSDEEGTIKFDPSNSGAGRMVLTVEDGGLVYVGGNLVDPHADCAPAVTDIHMDIPAGKTPHFIVENQTGCSVNASLLIINQNEQLTDFMINPWQLSVPFSGIRFGFIVGTNSETLVDDCAYIDYVALALDVCATPTNIPVNILDGRIVASVIKQRNPSAFIVDGSTNAFAVPAEINFGDAAAIVFRSGVDNNGNVSDMLFSFTIDPANRTPGEGNVVFDVEGLLLVDGSAGSANNKLEVLSWQVAPTGGPTLIGGAETTFPLRTFAVDGASDYLQYNAGCFLVNNFMTLRETNLVHTDKVHNVFENDDINSEPTYIGGDTFIILNDPTLRPRMEFIRSIFRIHTCVALTGVDLLIPNDPPSSNNDSIFRFYSNGVAFRDGSGRNMILGTLIGSTPCDPCCAAISDDAHLDIFQTATQVDVTSLTLTLETAFNDDTIIPNLPTPVVGAEIHTIYLGHSSNISIGTLGGLVNGLPVVKFPNLNIAGNYFSFETRGGPNGAPESSAVTGAGGIFVDTNGSFTIGSTFRANMAAMVVKSGNGSISLPRTNVYFDNRVGISDWQLDLTDALQRDIVADTEQLSDYTLNWRDVTKDYDNYTPYDVSVYDPCLCPTATVENVSSLPTVFGLVEQFQIRGSRLGSPASVLVDDGWIRELIFLSGCDSANAPTGNIILKNHGRVGLGSRHRNLDSLGASYVLGVNGVTIIADGDGRVDINEDIIINNICHILRGPNFNPTSPAFDRLQFHSDCERAIVVKAGGVLDLSSFTESNHIVEFAGNIKLLLEPGATVVLGGGILRMTDQASLETTPVDDLAEFIFGITTATTDPFRVRIVGTGVIQLDEDSLFHVGDDSYLGIETSWCSIETTDIEIEINDRAIMRVGSDTGVNNSVFQVGNTSSHEGPASITFKLTLQGVNSLFQISSRAFVGLGVGIVNNFFAAPTNWTMNTLSDVDQIDIQVPEGTFRHDRIFNSDDAYASLLTIGSDVGEFIFSYVGPLINTLQATILGGGNLALISSGALPTTAPVQTTDGFIDARRSVGLFSSKDVLNNSGVVLPSPATPAELFGFWKTYDGSPALGRFTNASQDEHNLLSVAYPDGGFIVRGLLDQIVGQGGVPVTRTDFEHSISLGTIYTDLNPVSPAPRPVVNGFELP